MPTNEELVDALERTMIDASRDAVGKRRTARAAVLARMTPGWQPIETAPRDQTDVLLCNANLKGGFPVVASWCEDINADATASGHCWWGQEASGRHGYHTKAFTHWSLLPELPPAPEPRP